MAEPSPSHNACVTFRFMAPDEQALRQAQRACDHFWYRGARIDHVVFCNEGNAAPAHEPYSVTLEGVLGGSGFLVRRSGLDLRVLLDETAGLLHARLRAA